jgi:signal transduction histidine kinase
MRFYRQLLLFMLAATVVPLVLGLVSLRLNEARLATQVLEAQREVADRLAERAGREVMGVLARVQQALGYAELDAISDEELRGLMAIVYRQAEDIVQVALLDGEGEARVPGVYLEDPRLHPEYAGRLGVSREEHAAFLARLPWQQALRAPAGSVVLGAPLARQAVPAGGLPVAVPVELAARGRPARWVAGVELSLAGLADALEGAIGPRGFCAWLLDEEGRALLPTRCGPAPEFHAFGLEVATWPPGSWANVAGDRLWAGARLEPLGWRLALMQPRELGWAQIRQARLASLGFTGLSILGLAVLGWAFSRRVTRDLRALEAAAVAYGQGRLDTRVEARSTAELDLLAGTFNRMGTELRASREEIEAWNRELTARVEQRTRELAVAQERLLETSKLAAIGQLGAGVAHEINNPLVGILGNVQLMLLKLPPEDPRREALVKIERAAKRTRDVVQKLLRFSEADGGTEHQPCDLHQVMEDALSLTQERILAQGVQVQWERAAEDPVVLADARQLTQVFLNLLDNARNAMPAGGRLTLATRRLADGVLAEVRDTGRGIPPENLGRIFEPFFTTKDVWTNTGLGLSEAYRIVADHGGHLEAESRSGHGSVFRVSLPVAEAADA